MFVILFTIPRVAGWIAHWAEFLDDPENKIVRPRQNYQGPSTRDYVPIEKRFDAPAINLNAPASILARRRMVSKH